MLYLSPRQTWTIGVAEIDDEITATEGADITSRTLSGVEFAILSSAAAKVDYAAIYRMAESVVESSVVPVSRWHPRMAAFWCREALERSQLSEADRGKG